MTIGSFLTRLLQWDSMEQTEGDFSTSFWADNVVQISQLNGMTMRGYGH